MATSSIPLEESLEGDMLQCPLCLQALENPVTLPNCLHNFCKECLEELDKTTMHKASGWACPKCNTFSAAEQIKQNDFLVKVLGLKDKDKRLKDVTCVHCTTTKEVKWFCANCRIELCEVCKNGHTNIPVLKNHSIVTLDSANDENVVDDLIMCETHNDRVMEMNCKVCEALICPLCKIKHDTHSTETVPEAIERLLPLIEENVNCIRTRMQHLEAKVKAIRAKIQDTKDHYEKVRKEFHERTEHLMSELKSIENEKSKMFVLEEQKAVKSLEDMKLNFEAQLNKAAQLVNMASLTTASGRNTSLLQQLQGKLVKSLKTASKLKSDPSYINIEQFSLHVKHDEDTTKEELSKVIGDVCETELSYKITADGQLLDSHHMCIDVSKYRNISCQVFPTAVDLPGRSFRISLFGRTVYVPLSKRIIAYNLSGKVVNQINVPFCVNVIKKLPTGHLVLGTQEGLYLIELVLEDIHPVKLDGGSYCDIDVYGNTFSALKCYSREVVTYTCLSNDGAMDAVDQLTKIWERQNTVKLPFLRKGNRYDTFCSTDSEWILCSEEDKCLYVCNTEGELLQTLFKDKSLAVCGIDCNQNVVLADYGGKALLCISAPELLAGQWQNAIELCKLPYNVFYAIFDDLRGMMVLCLDVKYKLLYYDA